MIFVSLLLVAGIAALVVLSDSKKLTATPEDFLSSLSGEVSPGEVYPGTESGETLAQKDLESTFNDFIASGFSGETVLSPDIKEGKELNEGRKTGPEKNVPAFPESPEPEPETALSQPDNGEKPREPVENEAVIRNPEVTSGSIDRGTDTPEPPDTTTGLLVFVFDDGGHNLKDLTPIVELPFPVTIAVLPGLGYSVKAAELVRQSGKELLLHQPMQAKNLSVDPGPGAIKPGMGYSDIVDLLIDNTNEVGPVVGMNNHEGSLITEDPGAMLAVLEFCRDRGLIFLDSRTTADTVVPEQAEALNMSFLERSVFIDNIQERESIVSSIREGMNVAKNKGSAVLIGHVWCQSIADIILDIYPEILDQGYKITTLTELLNYKESGEESL